MYKTIVSTVEEHGTIIAEKRQKRVVSITSYGRGKVVAVIGVVLAARFDILPMFIQLKQLCKDGRTEVTFPKMTEQIGISLWYGSYNFQDRFSLSTFFLF